MTCTFTQAYMAFGCPRKLAKGLGILPYCYPHPLVVDTAPSPKDVQPQANIISMHTTNTTLPPKNDFTWSPVHNDTFEKTKESLTITLFSVPSNPLNYALMQVPMALVLSFSKNLLMVHGI